MTAEKVAEMQKVMNELRYQIGGYIATIDRLTTENRKLTNELADISKVKFEGLNRREQVWLKAWCNSPAPLRASSADFCLKDFDERFK